MRPTAKDALFLALAAALAAAPYVTGLGFSSDDWSFLADFVLARSHSLSGLIRSLAGEGSIGSRPLQELYLVALYQAFGLKPLGYHLVNTAVFALSGMLLLLVLRELRVPRPLALAVPLLYLVLPHYTTARFWYANFQAGLSGALYLVSLYAGLRAARSPRGATWAAVSVVAVAAGLLAYEIVLPLALLHPLLFRVHAKRPVTALAVATWAAVAAIVAFKLTATTRVSSGLTAGYVRGLAHQVVHIDARTYGLHAPHLVWDTLRHYADGATIASASILALIALIYLRAVTTADRPASLTAPAALLASGAVVIVAGYAMFLTTHVSLSAAGSNNRLSMASAVGVALAAVGALGCIVVLLPRRAQPLAFALPLALTIFGASLLSGRLARYWIVAARQAQSIVAAIGRALPAPAPRSTVILDGFCRYVGPAVVFDAHWDLHGALKIRYRDPSIRADVVSPSLTVGQDGIHTAVYGERSTYPFARLYIYNYRRDLLVPIANAGEATRYFNRYDPNRDSGCPPGRPGHGTGVF